MKREKNSRDSRDNRNVSRRGASQSSRANGLSNLPGFDQARRRSSSSSQSFSATGRGNSGGTGRVSRATANGSGRATTNGANRTASNGDPRAVVGRSSQSGGLGQSRRSSQPDGSSQSSRVSQQGRSSQPGRSSQSYGVASGRESYGSGRSGAGHNNPNNFASADYRNGNSGHNGPAYNPAYSKDAYSRDTYSRSNRNRQHPQKKGIDLRIVLIIAIALVVILAGAFIAFAVMGNNKSADDTSQNNEVVVQDTKQTTPVNSENLVMNLNGTADTIVLKGEDYIESGCHVINKKTGTNLTNDVKTEGSVDTSNVGDYTITYSVSDSDGSSVTKNRTVHVVDSMDADTDGISVLMYHYVYTANDQPEEINGNYILDTDLDQEMAWLEKEGYYYPSYQELSAYIEGKHSLPKKSVIVTFDDGELGFLKYGIPVLEKHKVPATSFVIANDDDAADKVKNYASEYVSFQSHTYAMHQAGSNVGRGGRIHAMTQQEILEDLQKAASIVQNNEALAYPFGDNNDTAHAAVKQAGILCAFTINNDKVHKGDDPTCLNRVRISGEYTLESFIFSVESGVG